MRKEEEYYHKILAIGGIANLEPATELDQPVTLAQLNEALDELADNDNYIKNTPDDIQEANIDIEGIISTVGGLIVKSLLNTNTSIESTFIDGIGFILKQNGQPSLEVKYSNSLEGGRLFTELSSEGVHRPLAWLSDLEDFADDADVLHKTGNETKNGNLSILGNVNLGVVKTFDYSDKTKAGFVFNPLDINNAPLGVLSLIYDYEEGGLWISQTGSPDFVRLLTTLDAQTTIWGAIDGDLTDQEDLIEYLLPFVKKDVANVFLETQKVVGELQASTALNLFIGDEDNITYNGLLKRPVGINANLEWTLPEIDGELAIKTQIFISPTEPTGGVYRDGDIWFES